MVNLSQPDPAEENPSSFNFDNSFPNLRAHRHTTKQHQDMSVQLCFIRFVIS
jgi:hypothetical protein